MPDENIPEDPILAVAIDAGILKAVTAFGIAGYEVLASGDGVTTSYTPTTSEGFVIINVPPFEPDLRRIAAQVMAWVRDHTRIQALDRIRFSLNHDPILVVTTVHIVNITDADLLDGVGE